MGVSNAWAITFSGGYVYFDNTNTNWSGVFELVAHQYTSYDHIACTTMSKIDGTNNLYYVANPSGSNWSGIWGWRVMCNASAWGSQNSSESNLKQYATHYTASDNNNGLTSGYSYLCYGASTNNNCTLTRTSLGNSSTQYNSLNYTQTVQQYLSTDNGSTFATSTASIATIKVTANKLNGRNTTTSNSGTIASGSSTATCSAARTATVTYSVTGVNTGYKFVGWYDGNTQKSISTTYTYQATEAKTITARFEKTYAVTISAGANGTVSPTGSQQVGSTSVTIKATANTDYKFKNWTRTGGVTIENANNATTTITATAAGTVTANFEEDLTSTWHIVGDPTSIFKGTSTWAAHDDNMLKKTTGASTASKGSLTIDIKTLPANNDSYQFKVLNTNGPKWYGWSNETNNHFWVNQTITTGVYNADNNNLYFIPNALGEYKFAVDWSSSDPSLTVTFPTAYAVTFGKGTGGSSVTAKYNSTSFNSGTKVQSGKTVTFTQAASAGYTFKEWNTKSDGTGSKLSAEATYTRTVAATNTVYAIYTKKPDKTIYLEPTGQWNSDKAVFQAHVWQTGKTGVNLDMVGIGDPSYADSENKSPHKYYKVEVPAEYDNILFFRKDKFATANENAWNKTGDLTIPTDDKVLYTITEAGKGKAEGYYPAATGVWKKADLTYDVTLYSSEFGNYGFTYNGQTYTSPASGSIVYQVPIGATVQLFANPHNEAYNDNLMMNQGGTRTEVSANNTSLTINCNTILDDNYKTTSPHVVYLAVPNNGGDWVNNDATEHYAYAFHSRTGLGQGAAIEMEKVATVYVDKTEHYCYRCEIPAEYNTIRFEKRTSGGVTNIKTVDLNYQIPFNSVNCYRLNGKSGDLFTGVWETLPAIANDYRILYVEQTVEYGEIRFDKSHPSDIVKLTNTGDKAIVSLHLYNKRAEGVNGTNNAAVILQRCTGYDAGVAQWEEVEYHMVYNRLFSDASAALLPGRRNSVELQAHDGLEVIKAVADSEEHDYGSGVWNFTIKKTDGSATLLLDKENLEPYEGNYYIRTSNAEGGWINYSIPANYMTFSSYAKKHSDFSHYFCKWVNVSNDSRNVKFVVANDYGANISKELVGDDIIGKSTSDLPANANVRWQWNMVTNEVKRAYIDGATEDNITITKNNTATPVKLDDAGNWIYRTDLANIAPGDKITAITANYNGKSQTLLENTYQTDGMPMLTGEGTGYSVRVRYDFKINKTTVYLIPNGTNDATTNIDVLIERTDQGDAQQVSKAIKAADQENGYTVYAVMSFTQDHIEGNGTQSEKLYYWVSFPFDVRISDVFGFGEYGVHWIMEYYDGAERAKNGAWVDSPTYWRYITDTTSVQGRANTESLNCGILKANQGYVLALALNIANMGIFTNTDKVSLYFPSMSPITTQIDGAIIETTVTLDEYKCTIERDDRYIHDSNWHIIGVPSFSDKTQTLTQADLLYFYTRDQKNDTYIVTSATSAKDEEVTFKSLHSYMVQYAGTINWAATWELQPKGLAAKRNANKEKTHSLRLELSQNGTYNDQTLVTLQEEGATEAFDMNLDLSKMMNAGNNIYTLAGDELIQVAGNALPIANTVIPVGVQIAKAGEYTFAMPDGTDGITVELIDYETNTRTNLLLSEYTVNLTAGTCENRFALSVKPNNTATSLDNISGETGNEASMKKFIIDGVLYMQKDGVLYDAQGHVVR